MMIRQSLHLVVSITSHYLDILRVKTCILTSYYYFQIIVLVLLLYQILEAFSNIIVGIKLLKVSLILIMKSRGDSGFFIGDKKKNC